ncbi:ExbD/TolR family protein [Falsiporphyromonas endometrii]|uniref:ExbD/TolR family protein n=1 Tax=Falsiporphyromonas endometrii TaxID=1387297 RepID=A0ABV9K9V7_9PORP
MSLKRRNSSSPSFSMASMTDIIFLLLIFFMITSTFVIPNVIKVNLPASEKQDKANEEMARVTLTPDLRYFIAYGNDTEVETTLQDLPAHLQSLKEQHPNLFLAIYADKTVPYEEVVKIITLAARGDIKIMLATDAQTSDDIDQTLTHTAE